MLLLTDGDIRHLLDMALVIERIEQAFAAQGRGETLSSGHTHTDSLQGEFHVKTGGLPNVFGAKVNGAFAPVDGSARPSIRGMILLFDASDGTPLAIMDSGAITSARTGAATAVAAKYLARTNSSVLTIAGCGTQGAAQLTALAQVLPIQSVFAWSRSPTRAEAYCERMSSLLGQSVRPVQDLRSATAGSDVIVTCTPATEPFLDVDAVSPGAFVAAVGADSPRKQELLPELLAKSRVVPDVLAQCVEVGELHHAVETGLMQPHDIHAELGAIVAGRALGRTDDKEIFVFDSTGTALQDVAAGVLVYEKALAEGVGTQFAFRSD